MLADRPGVRMHEAGILFWLLEQNAGVRKAEFTSGNHPI